LTNSYHFCRIAGHTSEEVRDILATLETVYQPLFPQLNLRQWAGTLYTWLTFSRTVVAIDLKRFTASSVTSVECPDCGRTRSLSPVKGVLRFPPHDRRKMQTSVTGKRWSAKGKTDWDVVGG
jgi:hypothetical protein